MTQPALDFVFSCSRLFQNLSRSEEERLRGALRPKNVAAHSHILTAGQQHREVFILIAGHVKI